MDTPLTEKIIAQLGKDTEAIAIVNSFQAEWESQIRDAFEAAQQLSWEDKRCLNSNEYLKNQFNIEV
jgi:hypothetical protein